MIGESRIIGRLCRLRADGRLIVVVSVRRRDQVLRSDAEVGTVCVDDIIEFGPLQGLTSGGFVPSVTAQVPARDLKPF